MDSASNDSPSTDLPETHQDGSDSPTAESSELSAGQEGAHEVAQQRLHYSNNLLEVDVDFLSFCRMEYRVRATPALVISAYDRAVRKVGKEITMPGFRKGRAPADAIKKKFGPQIDREWQEEITRLSFAECQKLAHIPILHRDRNIGFKMGRFSREAGAELVISFEREPTLPTVTIAEFHPTEVAVVPVTQDNVTEMVRQVLLFFASWQPIGDRPVQEGDFVRLDVEIMETTPPQTLFQQTRFEVTKSSMAEWMYNLVLGQKTGAVLEGMSEPDADLPEEEKLELSPKKVRVTILAAEVPSYPELTDALAQQMGASNAAQMKENVQKILEKQARIKAQQERREQVTQWLVENHPFEVPSTLVEREAHFRMRHLFNDSEFSAKWKTMTAAEQRTFYKKVVTQSEKAVRLFYLCRHVLADAGPQSEQPPEPKGTPTPLEMLLCPEEYAPLSAPPGESQKVHEAEAFAHMVLDRACDYVIEHTKAK